MFNDTAKRFSVRRRLSDRDGQTMGRQTGTVRRDGQTVYGQTETVRPVATIRHFAFGVFGLRVVCRPSSIVHGLWSSSWSVVFFNTPVSHAISFRSTL